MMNSLKRIGWQVHYELCVLFCRRNVKIGHPFISRFRA